MLASSQKSSGKKFNSTGGNENENVLRPKILEQAGFLNGALFSRETKMPELISFQGVIVKSGETGSVRRRNAEFWIVGTMLAESPIYETFQAARKKIPRLGRPWRIGG